jgi:hypothetical protein
MMMMEQSPGGPSGDNHNLEEEEEDEKKEPTNPLLVDLVRKKFILIKERLNTAQIVNILLSK